MARLAAARRQLGDGHDTALDPSRRGRRQVGAWIVCLHRWRVGLRRTRRHHCRSGCRGAGRGPARPSRLAAQSPGIEGRTGRRTGSDRADRISRLGSVLRDGAAREARAGVGIEGGDVLPVGRERRSAHAEHGKDEAACSGRRGAHNRLPFQGIWQIDHNEWSPSAQPLAASPLPANGRTTGVPSGCDAGLSDGRVPVRPRPGSRPSRRACRSCWQGWKDRRARRVDRRCR